MKIILSLVPVCVAFVPASAFAQDQGELALEQFGTAYHQCLSRGAARASRTEIKDELAFAFAKKDCATQRSLIIANANGNPAVNEALDRIDLKLSANFAQKTRALRARRVAFLR